MDFTTNYSAASFLNTFHSELEAAKKVESLTMLQSPFQVSRRVHSTMNFIVPQYGSGALDVTMERVPLLETYSIEEQEKALIEDILYSLSGLETPLISTHAISTSSIGFTVDDRIDASLRDLVLQIAQVGGYYFTVTRFTETYCKFEHGQVNQALCASIRTILKEYHIFIAQMESSFAKGELTLQKLWYYINPILQKMSCIRSIVHAIEEGKCIGGQVLSVLHEKVLSMVGNDAGHDLCVTLAEEASKPYFKILESWIYKGVIKDPFGDFFVSEDESCISEDQFALDPNAIDIYWEKKYAADLNKCPSFLIKLHNEILKAGKYLNVIRQCGKDIGLHNGEQIRYNIHERMYVSSIDQAYSFASKTLLDVLLKDYDLMKRLESVKHYLLMSQGDFIMQFLDLAEDELRKPVEEIIETKLSSLLELALRTSSLADPYKDSIKVQLFPYGIRQQMIDITTIISKQIAAEGEEEPISLTIDPEFNGGIIDYPLPGFEAFAFSCEVEWPISLVLNYRAVYCYQIIFRHLFFCKHVERQLCRSWIEGEQTGIQNKKLETATTTSVFSLRHKMLNFVQNLLYYMAFEVIEPAWYNFTATMFKVQNVDDVLVSHTKFVNTVLSDSMLTDQTILDKMTELFRLCLRFCDKCLGANSAGLLAHPKAKAGVTIQRMDEQFTASLVGFLKLVSNIVPNPNQSSKVSNIIHRMNFNSYYTRALEAAADSA